MNNRTKLYLKSLKSLDLTKKHKKLVAKIKKIRYNKRLRNYELVERKNSRV